MATPLFDRTERHGESHPTPNLPGDILNVHRKAATRTSKSIPSSPQNPQTHHLSHSPSVLDDREIERGGIISAYV